MQPWCHLPAQASGGLLPPGGLPAQSERLADRAVFTTAYAFIPSTVMTDIVTSALPFWEQTRLWVLARPLSGFAETFSHYLKDTKTIDVLLVFVLSI